MARELLMLVDCMMVHNTGDSLPPRRSSMQVSKIRLLIAEDNAAYRSALIRFLKEYPSLEVVGEAIDGEDAIRRAEELRPTIVLMDINMPKLDAIAATRRLKAHYKEITVIGLSVRADRGTFYQRKT
jgi:DNA-binding NarL/FixJ family response regulator